MQLFITDEFKILKNNTIQVWEKRIVDQLRKVLRAKQGYNFFLQNKTWKITRYEMEVEKITDVVLWNIISQQEAKEQQVKGKWIILAILNKFDKMELAVQKLTEIWIKKIYFVPMERSVFKQIKDNKLERFFKISLEAAEQSWSWEMPDVKVFPKISEIEWTKAILDFDGKYYKDVDFTDIDFFVIWPEWWLTEKDKKQIEASKTINLWQNVLRAETAGIVAWFILNSK